MLRPLTTAVLLASLILSGAIGGFFYAYSVSVMIGLDASPPAAAIEVMQWINATVRNPVFFTTFFVTPGLCLLAALLAFLAGARTAALFVALAAAVYLLGAFLPTATVNVPMNRALATVSGDVAEAEALWTAYSERWIWWNTLRTVFSLISLGFVGAALVAWGRQTRVR